MRGGYSENKNLEKVNIVKSKIGIHNSGPGTGTQCLMLTLTLPAGSRATGWQALLQLKLPMCVLMP